MKKNIMLISMISTMVLMACNKNSSGNKDMVKQETVETKVKIVNGVKDSTTVIKETKMLNGVEYKMTTETYKATDGSNAKVTFTTSKDHDLITIESNNNKIQLNKDPKKVNTYSQGDATATVKGDSIIITQGNQQIDLVRAK